MDAILVNEELELKVYVLNNSKNIKQAHLLVTSFYGDGERAICIADINYQYNSIFNFITTDNYSVTLHKDYVEVIKQVSSMLHERYVE